MSTDQTPQNTKPRRRSFTQHLHRMFHVETSVDKKWKAQLPADTPPIYMPTSLEHNANQEFSRLTHQNPRRTSCEPLRPTTIESNNMESTSKLPLGQPAPRTSPPLQFKTSGMKGSPDKPEICVSPTWNKNMTRKNERRATRRLEKERLELERRLLRLEQAAQVENHTLPRNEPRRLIKKQPLGSSSRASSVGADESRASRFSSVFSRHSSRSRSRSSSVNEDKHALRHRSLSRADVQRSDQALQTASPALPVTLPERFGATVSKGLGVRDNALLPQHKYTDARLTDVDEHLAPKGINHSDITPQGNPTGDHRINEKKSIVHEETQSADQQSRLGELDRISFTASLKLDKRNGDVTQNDEIPSVLQSQEIINQETSNISKPSPVSLLKPSSDNDNSHHALNAACQQDGTTSLQELANNRTLVRCVPRKPHKQFTSSPLACSPTINSDIDITSASAAGETHADKEYTSPSNISEKTALSCQRTLHPVPCLGFPENKGAGKRPQGFKKHRSTADRARSSSILDPKQVSYKAASYDIPQNLATSRASRVAANRDSESGIQSHPKHRSLPYLGSLSTGLPELRLMGKTSQKDGNSKRASSIVAELDVHNQDQTLSLQRSSRQLAKSAGKDPSNISLSMSSSQESMDYDTADEPPSIASQQASNGHLPAESLYLTNNTLPKRDPPLHCNPRGDSTTAIQKAFNARPRKFLGSLIRTQQDQLVAKLFVICCNCKFWHDMPSEVYAKLAFPVHSTVFPAENKTGRLPSKPLKRSSRSQDTEMSCHAEENAVRCCWCAHHMSKSCCQGWTTIVHLRERHH